MLNETEILKRLTALEAWRESLGGKSAIEAAPKPALVEEGARITPLPPASSFIAPNENELRSLMKIAIARLAQMDLAPEFSGPRAEEKQTVYFQQFCAAFRALGHITRSAELDKKHARSYWAGVGEAILRAQGDDCGLPIGPAFLAAVIAHGDIPFNDPREYPFVVELGLRDYGMGTPATDGWRKVLAAGKAPAPTARKAPGNMNSPVFVRAAG
jgi:hypothetical protein